MIRYQTRSFLITHSVQVAFDRPINNVQHVPNKQIGDRKMVVVDCRYEIFVLRYLQRLTETYARLNQIEVHRNRKIPERYQTRNLIISEMEF